MIDEITMRELSHEALHRLADAHEALSRKLRAAADRKAAALSREQDRARWADKLRAIPDIVAGYEATGMSRDAAVRATATTTGVGIECVEAHMTRAKRQAKARAKQARDAEIIRLAVEEKLGSREIAKKVGVHFTTAARIIRAVSGTPR